jgi:hypothetical protein
MNALSNGGDVHMPHKVIWVWTLIALGVTASVSLILSARGLWRRQWHRSR